MPQTVLVLHNGTVRVSNLYDGSEYLSVTPEDVNIWFGAPPGACDDTYGYRAKCGRMRLKKRLADIIISAFGPTGRLGGFSGKFLGGGPSIHAPWLGFSEHETFDGASSCTIASLYHEGSGSYLYDLYECYCDLLTGKSFVPADEAGYVRWDSIFRTVDWDNPPSSFEPDYGRSNWSQGSGLPAVEFMEYGVYYDQAFYFSGGNNNGLEVPSRLLPNPAITLVKKRKVDELFCPMAEFYSCSELRVASIGWADDDTELDPYAFFEIFWTYYGYGVIPEYIDFYPASSAAVDFWAKRTNCDEISI